jgi:hypothetical protein
MDTRPFDVTVTFDQVQGWHERSDSVTEIHETQSRPVPSTRSVWYITLVCCCLFDDGKIPRKHWFAGSRWTAIPDPFLATCDNAPRARFKLEVCAGAAGKDSTSNSRSRRLVADAKLQLVLGGWRRCPPFTSGLSCRCLRDSQCRSFPTWTTWSLLLECSVV